MLKSVYNKAKLSIFERCENGTITPAQKSELLTLLEETKDATELNEESIKDFFAQLVEKFPDNKDDIEKLHKKLAKEDEKEEEAEEKKDEEEAKEDEEQVSESAKEMLDAILSEI